MHVVHTRVRGSFSSDLPGYLASGGGIIIARRGRIARHFTSATTSDVTIRARYAPGEGAAAGAVTAILYSTVLDAFVHTHARYARERDVDTFLRIVKTTRHTVPQKCVGRRDRLSSN